MRVSDVIGECREILGSCSNATILSRLTEAVQVLANKGDFDPMIGYMDICACSDGRTVTLPREVDTILALNISGQPAIGRNKWFEFHFNGPGSPRCGANSSGYYSDCGDAGNGWGNDSWTWDDRNDYPVFMDIITPGYLIGLVNAKNDLGATVRIFGTDDTGNEIWTQEPDGTWKSGFKLPLNLITDFPNGIIVPDSERIFSRIMSTAPMVNFSAVGGSQNFSSGALVLLSLVNAPLPTPLTNGGFYYVRSVDGSTVTLHNTKSGALTNTDGVTLTSTSLASIVSLRDTRVFKIMTKFTSGVAHNLATADLVEFTAGTMPVPLVAATDYYARKIDATNFTVHATEADATTNTNPIDVSSAGSGVVVRNKKATNPGTYLTFSANHNLLNGDAVTVDNFSGDLPEPLLPGVTYYVGYLNAKAITLHNTLSDATVRINPITFLSSGTGASVVQKRMNAQAGLGTSNQITASGHNLAAGDFAEFECDGTFPTPLAQKTVYMVASPYSTGSFTIQTPAGSAVNVTALGGGQLSLLISRTFGVGFTSAWDVAAANIPTAAPVKVQSTVTLPACSPVLSDSTVYYARHLSDTSIELFETSAQASDQVVRNVISRERASNVATLETDAAHGLIAGDYIRIENVEAIRDGVLATVTVGGGGGAGYTNNDAVTLENASGFVASATIAVTAGAITAVTITAGGCGFAAAESLTLTPTAGGAGGTYTVATVTNGVAGLPNTFNSDRIIIASTPTGTTFTYASSGLDEGNTAETGGTTRIAPIRVIGAGVGDVFIVLETAVTAGVDGNYLRVTSGTDYLTDNAPIRLETTGTLPAPFATSTDYRVKLSTTAGIAQIVDYNTGNPITPTNIGSGDHDLYISNNFTSAPPTYIVVTNNEYNDGDAVTLSTTGTLPAPLNSSTTYYLRRVDENSVELYDTYAHAIDTLNTTGRITTTSTGSGQHTLLQTVANIKVARVSRVEKSLTNQFLDVYCWDEGRLDNLTLIGHYHPQDQVPSYRRIRVNQNCCWIRIRYHMRTFTLTSEEDWIPFNSRTALVYMVRSLQLFRDGFVEQAESYEKKSVQYLEEEQAHRDVSDGVTLQFNDPVFTNPGAMWMS